MASVLFMDIVSYSLKSIDDQTDLLTNLQKIVRETAEYKQAAAKEELISLPTGDGMALVFLHDPVSPVRCALEVAAALRDHPEIKLRMGVHTGPVRRHADIKQEVNVVGGGINIAQRVMDCGDAGHILLSRNVAEVLEQLRGWSGCLQDLGVQEVKHGVKVQLFNLCKDGLGNPALPKKISSAVEKAAGGSRNIPPAPKTRVKWPIAAGIGIALVAAAGYLWFEKSHAEAAKVAPPLAPQIQRTLTYYVTVQRYRNGKPYKDPFRLSGERVFEADYRIRLSISSPERGFLYVLNEGPRSTPSTPDVNALFPSPAVRAGSAEIAPSEQVQIPPGGYFVFDEQKGREKLYVVWSTAAIRELDDLKKWINSRDRGAVHDVQQARDALALCNKYAAVKVQTEKDDARQMTILKAAGETFAWMIPLDHE